MSNRAFNIRVWDLENKRWLKHPKFNVRIDLFGAIYLDGNPVNGVIQQFTGLFDKNSCNPIYYEGDILRGDLINDGNEIMGAVEFTPRNGVRINNVRILFDEMMFDGGINISECQVFGNIFENPRFLDNCITYEAWSKKCKMP